jgi:hemoglobin
MLTETHITALVHNFYDKVRADPTLGPVFADAIGAHWGPHLQTMCDFWSALLLGTRRFDGRPLAKHLGLRAQITPAHFQRWLVLFGETADEVLPEDGAAQARLKAFNIAQAFQHHMFDNAAVYARSAPMTASSSDASITERANS